VRQQDSILGSGVLENFAIMCGTKADILNSNKVDCEHSPKQAANDSSVKVFVGEKADHFLGLRRDNSL
jgi:hypothetical protein